MQAARSRRSVVLAAALVLPTAAALAYFTAGVTGSSQALTDVAAPVTLSTAAPADTLWPGAVVDLRVTVTNPGASTVRLSTIQVDTAVGTGGITVDAGHPGCPPSTLVVAVADPDNGGAGWPAPPGESVIALVDAATLSVSAADACQGAVFSVALEAP